MSETITKLNQIKEEVGRICSSCGRDPGDVGILAVSKTKPVSMIRELYDLGHRDFGENYAQELTAKAAELPPDIRWHMIGHLQRNKVKLIAPFIAMIHSVDSLRLAETIEKEAEKCERVIPVLLEINAGQESTKYGTDFSEAERLFTEIRDLPHVEVRGFMTSAPMVGNAEENRAIFRQMHDFMVDINLKKINNNEVNVLSMGMSGDYKVAVEEGATIIRIGTAIFGPRQYINNGGTI